MENNTERIENFNHMCNMVQKEVEKEMVIDESDKFMVSKKGLLVNKVMSTVFKTIFGKLLGNFKVVITVYWHEKPVIEYQIPKD